MRPNDAARTLRSIEGKIVYVRKFNPGSARRLQRYLEVTLAYSRTPERIRFSRRSSVNAPRSLKKWRSPST